MVGKRKRCIFAKYLVLCCFLFVTSLSLEAKGISPLSMGLKEAKTGVDRYWVLYKTHLEAVKQGVDVDYRGVNRLDIEVPKDAKPIPISGSCNFRGMTLNVLNTVKDMFLFEMDQRTTKIKVDKWMIDSGNFNSIPEFKKGLYLLIVEDETPWIENRKGHSYGHIRKDCILLRNGKALNHPISPYNNEQTNPRCEYTPVASGKKTISNLTVIRDSSSTFKTLVLNIARQNNITIKRINVQTPQNDSLFADRVFQIESSSNVRLIDCYVNGTYSQKKKYGYGFNINNVYNLSFKNVKANAKWGVFCSSNVNNVFLEKCSLNRVDTHCYGRDVKCVDCHFFDRECSMTSFFGSICYLRCYFDNCIPLHFDGTYGVYTDVQLSMKNCKFKPGDNRSLLISAANLPGDNNEHRRAELRRNYWPFINIYNLQIITPEDKQRDVYLFWFVNKYSASVINNDVRQKIKITKLVKNDNTRFHIANVDSLVTTCH